MSILVQGNTKTLLKIVKWEQETKNSRTSVRENGKLAKCDILSKMLFGIPQSLRSLTLILIGKNKFLKTKFENTI